jgi:DNA polymerase elongation subunit (family B)
VNAGKRNKEKCAQPEGDPMETAEGWFFDVYIQGARAVLWVKTGDGRNIRLTDSYTPFFHIEPAEGVREEDLVYRVSESPDVRSARVEEKLTSLDTGRAKNLIRVEPHDTRSFRSLLKLVERSPLVSRVYNAGMRHVQRYLLTRLKIEPTSKVAVSFEGNRLVSMQKLDDADELPPPPFSLMPFSVDYDLSGSGSVSGSMFVSTSGSIGGRSLRGISAGFRGENREFRGDPPQILIAFRDYVAEKDPDLLLCPKCDRATYPLLRSAFQGSGIPFSLGRCGDPDQVRLQGSFAGRIMLGGIFYGFSTDEWGVAGLVERTRFSFSPIGLGTRWLSNKSIDSRHCFELLRRGYAIPREEYFEDVRVLKDLVSRDRGGITITPEAGRLHENVAALDFDSQYPNIIVKNNLSYECMRHPGNETEGEGAATSRPDELGILPATISPWLERRLRLKKLKKSLPPGTPERTYCEERVNALKMILVCAYGISGCCRNRFGNVLTFEEINKKSRECMLKAKAIAESNRFKIIYGDVDSIFLSKAGASKADYEALAAEIAGATGLSMSLDRHFRFIAFLPLKGDHLSSALKRYFGLTFEGRVEARGIELRRSDTPGFIRAFQEELIRQVMGSRDSGEVLSEGVGRGMALLQNELARLKNGEIGLPDLVVSRRLGKETDQYAASVCQKSAAIQLLRSGREIEVGDDIPFIYIDHDNPNPLCRVAAPELFTGSYDRDIYARFLREAASTVWRGMGVDPKPDNNAVPTLERWL